jgi:RND family efflux transporter MFP subunit
MGANVTFSGVLTTRDETDLAFTVPGVVSAVLVRAGDRVTRGQRLAVLDAQQVEATLEQAQVQLDKAERDLARARRLYADSVIALATLQDAETGHAASKAAVSAAAFARRTAVIVAPSDGVILERLGDPGSVVGPGTPLLRFAGSGSGTVFRGGVADRDLLRLRLGDAAEVVLDADVAKRWAGRVVEIAAAPTPRTGTWLVTVTMDGASSLPRGLSGQAVLARGRPAPSRVVPISAVVEADGEAGVVFVVINDVAVRRAVRLSVLQDGLVAVHQGLDGATRVVTAGAAYLNDGDRVREAGR